MRLSFTPEKLSGSEPTVVTRDGVEPSKF